MLNPTRGKGGGETLDIDRSSKAGQDHFMLKRIYTMGLSHKMLSGKSQCQLEKNPVHYEIGVYEGCPKIA